MQATSRAYKTEQAEHLRERSFVWVYLGVINREAQRSAEVVSDVTEWSQPAFDSQELEGVYATYEENFIRCDGSQLFPPRDVWAMYQGTASEGMVEPIVIEFGKYKHLNTKGLTIKFYEDAYPTRFRITNGTQYYDHEFDVDDVDENGNWVCNDEFLDTERITIIPYEMKGGQQRLRIINMLFGVGFSFSNSQLLSTSRKNSVSHLSEKLPSKSFSFSVDNTNRTFSADDPHSYIHFLQEQQEVEYDYGRELSDGTIYVIKGGRTALKKWASNDQKATFDTVGFLDYMDTTYNKGKYYPNGISLYDLAVEVLEDAGVEVYHIDTYLKKVITHNPLPKEKHKNLLQLIANAGMCVMYEDRKGELTIAGSFQPEVTAITSNGVMPYSKLVNVLKEDVTVGEYATFENNFSYADSHQYFRPRGTNYIEASYVSSAISDDSGNFTTNPRLTIEWEAKWTFFNLTVRFFDAAPKQFRVHMYADGVEKDVVNVDEETIDMTTLVQEAFYDVDKIVLEFVKTSPYQRIHLKNMRFGSITDYTIDYKDLYQETPNASTTEFVKNVNCHYFEYGYASESKKLSTVEAIVGENVVTFKNASYDYSLAYQSGSGTLSIIESGAYYLKFSSTAAGKVVITGKEYTVTEGIVTDKVRETGVDKTSRNVLLDNLAYATRNLAWLKAYYENDVTYALQYRGEPAIDCDDLIYLENKFVVNNLIRVTSEQIDTSTGMSMNCKLTARRVDFTEPAIVDFAVVDVSEVE